MALIVDDLLSIPGEIGKIILNALAQTVEKVAWVEYSKNLKKLLLRARHDYETGKITKEQFQEIEKYVFREMRIAKRAIGGEDRHGRKR